MSKLVSVEINNHHDFGLVEHPFTLGAPFPDGWLYDIDDLRLHHEGAYCSLYARPLAKWPDGSLKWVLLDFHASIPSNTRSVFQLEIAGQDHDSPDVKQRLQSLAIEELPDAFIVDTGVANFRVSKVDLNLIDQVSVENNDILRKSQPGIMFVDDKGERATAVIDTSTIEEETNWLRKSLRVTGHFDTTKQAGIADFDLVLSFFAGSSTVKCEFTLSNPCAADHPGGVWDLGDKGSLFFQQMTVSLGLLADDADCQSAIRIKPGDDWSTLDGSNLRAYQASSGGKNWDSQNHVDFMGQVPLEFKGYRLYENDTLVGSGDRAEPIVNLTSGSRHVSAYIENFWQNFPGSIEASGAGLTIGLFPMNNGNVHELQGGERKRQVFYLDFSDDKNTLDAFARIVVPKLSLEHYYQSEVIPWLPADYEKTVIQGLIERGIEGEKNFFEKREAIDEYGWRNFGDVYADHEQHEYNGDEVLISHYNNQYDPIYGFLRQYLISGDERWRELYSDLADHVVDIDIYHTRNDRDEYNGGLFWHTFHYLNAFTCTHRTFSIHHKDDFIYGEVGGGPGSEHCYTTGMAYCYFMTGDERFRTVALRLIDWMVRVMDGSGTVLERLFQFKSKDIPILKRLISGDKVQCFKYPFTRGTGNFISSLIDGYNLTGDRKYLTHIEEVITQTTHPDDDISLRNLHDKEFTWSYLVYLQAICKYIDIKAKLQEPDAAYQYARDCLLHYADWMVENEAPFLETPDILEYPNHSWVAQDLRKVSIFFTASLCSHEDKDRYLKAARYYVEYVGDNLKEEETRYYTRIIVLLLQNDIHESSLPHEKLRSMDVPAQKNSHNVAPEYSVAGLLGRFIMDILSRLTRLSLRQEMRWLKFRLR